MVAAHNALPCVTGYLADNFNPSIAAVVLNEAASPIALLGWCCAELQSLAAASAVVAGSGRDITADDFGAIFEHRLPALVGVLGYGYAATCATRGGTAENKAGTAMRRSALSDFKTALALESLRAVARLRKTGEAPTDVRFVQVVLCLHQSGQYPAGNDECAVR